MSKVMFLWGKLEGYVHVHLLIGDDKNFVK